MISEVVTFPTLLVTMKFVVPTSLVLLCLFVPTGIFANAANNTSTLHLVAFVPYMTGGYYIKSDHFGYRAAIQMAVNIINNRTDILPDYKIKVHFGETYVKLIFY